MLTLAEKYLHDHNKPIVKNEIPSKKFFLKNPNDPEELNRCNQALKCMETVLRHDRVDRRCARAVAMWLPGPKLAKLTKIIGALSNFGSQNKDGKFINAEEMLFLLETNRLEVFCDGVPLSLLDGFKTIFNFDRYLIYKTLLLQGYKLKQSPSLPSIDFKDKKRKSQFSEESVSKKVKDDKFEDIFSELRKKGPQQYIADSTTNTSTDYIVASNSAKNDSSNLIISNCEDFCSNIISSDYTSIYALGASSNSFCKLTIVNLPIL